MQLQTKEASNEYHDAIRKHKKTHWDEFSADDINICQAAWYKKPAFDKIPPLTKADDSATMGKTEQATELLKTFLYPYHRRLKIRVATAIKILWKCSASRWRRLSAGPSQQSHDLASPSNQTSTKEDFSAEAWLSRSAGDVQETYDYAGIDGGINQRQWR